jgi:hypothetical protein
MKKLNNKGIGHNLLVLVVAVMAVVGSAGYFVWQRQQNNDIDAKAAGYTYGSNGASLGYGARLQRGPVSYKACATKLKRGGYQINMYFRTDFSGPGKGQIIVNGTVVHSFTAAAKSTTLSSKTLNSVSTLEFTGEYYSDYKNGVMRFQSSPTNIANIISCNKGDETANYKYEVVASNSERTVQYFACKIKSGTSWKLETKLLSFYATQAESVDPNKSDYTRYYTFTDNLEFGPGIVSFGNLSPVLKKGAVIQFGGEYILDPSNIDTIMTLQSTTKTIDTVANCI